MEPTRVRRSGSTGSSQLDFRLLRNGKRKHRPQRLKERNGDPAPAGFPTRLLTALTSGLMGNEAARRPPSGEPCQGPLW